MLEGRDAAHVPGLVQGEQALPRISSAASRARGVTYRVRRRCDMHSMPDP
jgi:hypothetical protein